MFPSEFLYLCSLIPGTIAVCATKVVITHANPITVSPLVLVARSVMTVAGEERSTHFVHLRFFRFLIGGASPEVVGGHQGYFLGDHPILGIKCEVFCVLGSTLALGAISLTPKNTLLKNEAAGNGSVTKVLLA